MTIIYVRKEGEEIIGYDFRPDKYVKSRNTEGVILEITEEQWKQSKYGEYADIVGSQFIIKEIPESNDSDSALNGIRKFFILDLVNSFSCPTNPYTAPSDGVVDVDAWNNGGHYELQVLVNGRSSYRNYSGGNYGDENESKHARVPVHKGDIIQRTLQNCNGAAFNFIPYKYN